MLKRDDLMNMYFHTVAATATSIAAAAAVEAAKAATITYLPTPWSKVLLEKLTGSAPSQEITSIFGTRKFLAVFTSAHHLSLSCANSIQSPKPPPTS
jgi:hypothetical protein